MLDIGHGDVPKVCSSLNHHFDGVGHTQHQDMGDGLLGECRGTVRWHGFRSETDAQRKQLQPLL